MAGPTPLPPLPLPLPLPLLCNNWQTLQGSSKEAQGAVCVSASFLSVLSLVLNPPAQQGQQERPQAKPFILGTALLNKRQRNSMAKHQAIETGY